VRGVIRVPVVTSAGVTGWKGLAGGVSLLRVTVCVVATALVFLPTNMTRIRVKKLPSAGQGSKERNK